MPVREVQPGDVVKTATKILIVGPPNSRKTTVAGWLPKLGPTGIYALPGEAHTDKILTPRPNMKLFLSDPLNTSTERTDWVSLWTEIRDQTRKMVGGSKTDEKPTIPGLQFAIFDGYHKAYEVAKHAGLMKHPSDTWKAWDFTNSEYLKWIQQGIFSPHVEWCLWLGWSEKEQTEGSKKKSVFPFLPGKMQQYIMGEVNVILQTVEGGVPYWQLQQTDDAMGIGIRVPEERAKTMPVRIKADWTELKKILQG